MEPNDATLARKANALSDPLRLQILDLLVKGHDEFCQSPPHPEFPKALCPYLDIQSKLGNIAPSKLSYHLKELRQAELVEEHRLGKRVYYTANLDALTRFLEAFRQRYLISPISS
ncbi:MAG: winged helix-turn-helix transcriptional regulator [Ktedonobacteraceae bacterium]|nr:winged helix-turn-helix transcriptional regulator [Ktedonobacteraceae bacterium]MBO0795533.1 winged helix-turn-helix transcriptional regulator [Ktedonobacteraceae bacterium]